MPADIYVAPPPPPPSPLYTIKANVTLVSTNKLFGKRVACGVGCFVGILGETHSSSCKINRIAVYTRG